MRPPPEPDHDVNQVLAALWDRVRAERDTPAPQPRHLLSRRLGGQALACVAAGMRHDPGALVPHSADLLASLFALWAETGLDPAEVWTELHKREQLGSLLMQLNQAQGAVRRRVLKPWRVDSTKLP